MPNNLSLILSVAIGGITGGVINLMGGQIVNFMIFVLEYQLPHCSLPLFPIVLVGLIVIWFLVVFAFYL